MSVTVGILIIGVTFLLYYLQKIVSKDKRIKTALDKIPGPATLPIVGNALYFNVPHTDLMKTVSELFKRYGRRVRIWAFNTPYVLISNYKDAEDVLSSPVHVERTRDYNVMKPWLGTSLFISGGEDWSRRRKFLTPAFTFGLQKEFIQVFNEQGAIFRQVMLDEVVDKGKVNLYPYCFRYSLDVICEAAMGTKIYAQTKKNVEYLNTLLRLTGLIAGRILRPWLQLSWIWKFVGGEKEERQYLKTLHGFTDNVIKERRKFFIENPQDQDKYHGDLKKRRLAFLDLLLQSQLTGGGAGRDYQLSDQDIRNETDLFMAAGHDTSGGALSWTLFLLAHHPEIQKKVQMELDGIFGEENRPVTNDDLSKMQYLEMCFKESLRLRPPIPFIFRYIHDDLRLKDGTLLPAGTSVGISIIDIHMDPEVYPNPEEFIPERFSPENCSQRNSYAWIPFSAGPRSCLGQRFGKIQGKISLSTLLRHFWFEPTESWEGVKIVPEVNLRPVNGLHFKVTRRPKSSLL